MTTENLKKTPLVDEHISLGGRMVDFAGWYMPVQYKGLREEHSCVRNEVGLFDVSHMGEIRFRGPKALESLEWLTTNQVSKLEEGEAQYNLLPNDQGGLVDDIFIYCLKKNEDYLVCVNASNKDKDYQWMKTHNRGADVKDESADWGQIAVQGPKATELLARLFGEEIKKLPRNRILELPFQDSKVLYASTGYTGEAGAEIFVPKSATVALWRELLKNGADLGVQPIGLGARDTLRTEMKFSLYGHEIDDHSNPFEAGLGWVVKPTAKDFMGKSVMLAAKEKAKRKLVGFKMLEKGIPRQGYNLFSVDGQEIGAVTSGTHSPTLDEPIGIAYIAAPYSSEGSEFCVDIRGRKVKAQVVKTPFINKA
jgi:aminomethyltransferase